MPYPPFHQSPRTLRTPRPAHAPAPSGRRAFLLGLGALALAASHGRVRANEEASVHDFDWFDPARARAVPARLHLPPATGADASAGPVPLVVVSHGMGGSRRGYSYIGAYLAQRGVPALHVQHVGSDNAVWRGNPFEILMRLQSAAQDAEAEARVADLGFALDRAQAALASAGSRLQIDPARIFAVGHSYGANTALLAAGARVVRGERTVMLRDERVRAVVAISAPPFYGEADQGRVLRHVAVPSLHVTSTGDVISVPGYHSPASDRLALFDAVGDPRKALVVYRDGSHSMFTDRTGTGGMELNRQVKAATRELIHGFVLDPEGQMPAERRDWLARWQPIVATTSLKLG